MEQLTLKESNEFVEDKKPQEPRSLQVNVCASFVIEPIQDYFESSRTKLEFPVHLSFAPYNQLFQQLLSPNSLLNQSTGINCLFIRIEDWLRDRRGQSPIAQIDFLDQTYRELIPALQQSTKYSNVPFLVGIVAPSPSHTLSSDTRDHITQLNGKLEAVLKDLPRFYLLDLQKVASIYQIDEVFDTKSDQLGHIPFTAEFYEALAIFLVRKIRAFKGPSYKVIALDCDNTLWKGICGELGALNVVIEENYTYLQEFLIEKYNDGFLLVLCSKNNEDDVWEVFEKHPGMKLKREHIAAHRINWNPKHGNLISIAKELNLGTDSIIFLDDSSFEVEQMAFAGPEIHSLCLPDQPHDFVSFLNQAWAFDVFRVTEEDRQRNKMYKAEKQRSQELVNYAHFNDFLKSLNIQVDLRKLEEKDAERALQLTLRTNQFNLNGIRKSPEEISSAIWDQSAVNWIIEVKDRFGEYGKSGLVLAKPVQDVLVIETFLLSCRVLGRNVEDRILSELKKYCEDHGLRAIIARFRSTSKNQPFFEFLSRENWEVDQQTKLYKHTINGSESRELEFDSKSLVFEAESNPPIGIRSGSSTTLPTTDAETTLYNIWKGILGHDRFDINDDFFRIGGNSLKAVQLVSRVSRQFLVDLQLTDFYYHPTISQLAAIIPVRQKNSVPASVIEVLPRPEKIPLSFSQERLWFIDQLEGSIHYHVPEVFRLKGNADIGALENALKTIVNRHEVLRTVILDEEGQPYQYIKKEGDWSLTIINDSLYKNNPPALRRFIDDLIRARFDLSKDDMIRGHLVTLGEDEHILVITMHHIASDGWSSSIFVKELVALYEAYVNKEPAQLQPLTLQYADYALWQRHYLRAEQLNRKMSYWKEKLAGVTPLELPLDYPRPAIQSIRGATISFNIDNELSGRLQKFSGQQGATLFMTLLATFKVLLYRYTGHSDICVGTPTAGRQQQELEELIGFFVNTLALRSEVTKDVSFIEFLRQVRSIMLEAYGHQEVPFEKVVEIVIKERDISRSPLFQVFFVLQNTPDVPELRLGNVILSKDDMLRNTSKFDLSLYLTETANGLEGNLEYCTDLFTEETILRLISHYKELLYSVVKSPSQKIGALSMLATAEQNRLLSEFNGGESFYPRDKTISGLFEDQAAKTPDHTAVFFEGQSFSYRQLNERANQLGHYLRKKGIAEETLVPICIERGLGMIVGLLGILKAGAAFVPVDPEYPFDRISYMLTDSGATTVVSSKESKSKLNSLNNLDIIDIDESWSTIKNEPATNLRVQSNPHHLAYVIYTSGSTGKPKGVMIEQLSVINLLKAISDKVHFTSDSSFLSVTTFSFDICYLEFYVPLINGGKLIVVPREVALDGFELSRRLSHYRPTHMQGTPATWQLLLDEEWENKESMSILIGGEAVKESLKDRLTQLGEVYNLYGPTETTIWSAIKKLETGVRVSIGNPLANTSIYIVNEELQLCPINVAGEICIAGDGLARGYLNRPDLTEEKFIKDPFSSKEGAKMYKTGDLGRWLPDGSIEYIRRIDDQVKIRGYRIELGEIETALLKSELVNQAVVVAREEKGNSKRLVSYYIPRWQAVKAKERELYEKQVASWKEIYETEYANTKTVNDEEFDINIWNDSFTGDRIADEQMREWVNDIVEVILSGQPEKVLEIGCGTGLIYYQLAGKVKKYIGTDFSVSSINQIRNRIDKGLRDYGPTDLHVCAAHEVSLLDGEQLDTVILNSIVQYFPGEDYMTEVIGKSISLLNGNGRIVIGDVRDNRLLELFKARLKLQRLQHAVSVQEFRWLVEQDVLKEEELCFSPEYFFAVKSIYPGITNVEIKWKQSDFINELTLYRYTVVLHIGSTNNCISPQWQNWNDLSEEAIVAQLKKRSNLIAVQNFPNPRLWKEQLLSGALKTKMASTVGDLLDAVSQETETMQIVRNILKTAMENGFKYQLFLNEDPLLVNLVFELIPSQSVIENPYSQITDHGSVSHTNIPLFSDISLLLQKNLKSTLHERLPEYMVPTEFIALNHLPLTNNGKIDRRFLSSREDRAVINKLNFESPRTKLEILIANIWQELLGLSSISIHDNFFELGGHSLLATRLVSAVRRELQVEFAIKELFLHPQIITLAGYLEGKSRGLVLPQIKKQERPANTPLSFSQERLWFIDKLEGSLHYHLPLLVLLKGDVDKKALDFALHQLVLRHEVLRTVIREAEGEPYQYIKDKADQGLIIIDEPEYIRNDHEFKKYIGKLIDQPFDLSKDDMLRAHLIKINNEEHRLLVTMHHLASDGWSLSIFVEELAEFYNSYVTGNLVGLQPLDLQYADYALWQRRYLRGDVLENKVAYWKKKLNDLVPLQLPTDYPRPAVQSTGGAIATFSINSALTGRLQDFSQQQGTTVFMTLQAAFKVLLHRYSGQEDICVGSVIADRPQQEVERLIGFFVNTVALRGNVNSNESFTDLLQQVKITTLEAYENQEVPFEKVVEVVVKERDRSRSPLFQVMLVWQNTPPVSNVNLDQVQLIQEEIALNRTKFDITFIITETSEGLKGIVEYSTALYKASTIDRMTAHFTQLLSSVVKQPARKIGLLSMLTHTEQQRLFSDFNPPSFTFRKDKTLIALFEEQAIKTPENIALIFDDHQLNYRELNERANQLAHYLRSRGVKEETLVPVCMERSSELIISLLAIVKAGGAYVPIDPEYPSDRIAYMLEDTGALITISNTTHRAKLQATGTIEVVDVQEDRHLIDHQSKQNPGIFVAPHHLAYVIYTSGSTGKPKGVLIEHGSVVNLIDWHLKEFGVSQNSRATAMAGIGFDAFGWEVWPYLSEGACVYIVDDRLRLESSGLADFFTTSRITHSFVSTALVPDFVSAFKNRHHTLKYLLTGGDKLSSLHTEGINYKIVNNYGPTEYTVVTTSYELTPKDQDRTPPIGRPISNTMVVIVDNQKQVVPVGVAGELCVGGEGLARGYLNQEALTAQKFVTIDLGKEKSQKMYCTGDLGRWLEDGTIEYLGRKDDQVKIRGYRIELGEIESVLLQTGLVTQAIVLIKEDAGGDKQLVAYVVAAPEVENEMLIAHLKGKLPQYMVPALWVRLESLPLTANGKIDKKALPEPDTSALINEQYVAPQTQVEQNLATIWKELLHLEKVGIHDNFFKLGGHSLLARRMVSYIERNLAVSVPIHILFQFNTISELGKYLEIQLNNNSRGKDSKGFKVVNI